MAIRDATPADIEAMVTLSEAFRQRLTTYSPTFWRKAEDSFARQVTWFEILLGLDDTIALVDDEEGSLRGFVIGRLTPAPPVYAPGGPGCLIDDFCVTSEDDWPTVGRALLAEIEARSKQRGAGACIVICAHLDARKRAFLAQRDFAVTAEWHVRTL
ncbi:MAG: N-acetyltransferase [Deltaproteobacteria bacterium]|nr:N-acetyltransferase [Deltaproteobacteria bacterium]MBI3386635.1 N-acetyltransferase [Deltaproteobacteria bacterium]